MHLASLSSQLNISIQELRAKAAVAGIRIPPRASKVDHAVAEQLLNLLSKNSEARASKQVGPKAPTQIKLSAVVTVRELADALRQPVTAVIKKLVQNGVLATINESLDFDTAAIIAHEFGVEAESSSSAPVRPGVGHVKEVLAGENQAVLKTRPPVVAVMGHVDHGKTTLLDAIRSSEVAGSESGGITQHIGAYSVKHKGRPITFLDTPGHEAFAAMRARGASVTDMIVLVVAADDGVRPQTVEVINRAKFAQIPLVVAINKVDAPGANIQRVLQELATAGVLVESWGGETLVAEISARNKQGIDQLLDFVLLQADILELGANPQGQMVATVIESQSLTGQGAVATVIVQNGTLKVGDAVFAGATAGKVKNLLDDKGHKLSQVLPGFPALVVGLSDKAEAGDVMCAGESVDAVKRQAELIRKHEHSRRLQSKAVLKTDDTEKKLALIIKADVAGSLEAVEQALAQIKTDEVTVEIVQSGVGDVSDSEVLMASNAKASILAFRAKTSPTAAILARQKGVVIDQYDVIYELLADVTDAVLKMCTPEYERVITGRLKILQIFRTDKDEQIVGGRVTDGEVASNLPLLVVREGQELGQVKILELQEQKTSSSRVGVGHECGMKLSGQVKLKVGDEVQNFTETLKKKILKAQ